MDNHSKHNGHDVQAEQDIGTVGVAPELAQRKQWVGYKAIAKPEDPGFFGKEPHQVFNPEYLASDTNPAHWTTLTQATRAVQAGTFDGMLFAVSGKENDVSSCDLDQVINPQTGEQLPEYAEGIAILQQAGRLEWSPSGRGLRWWGWGKLPDNVQVNFPFGDHRKIEFYGPGHPHFASCTGKPYGNTPDTLGDPAATQAALLQFHAWTLETHARLTGKAKHQDYTDEPPRRGQMMVRDWLLFTKIGTSKDNAKFLPLWNANDMRQGGDDSRGDAQFCKMLAFWLAKDATRMDTCFRTSSRMRPKWDERHFADPPHLYGERLIQKAIEWTFDTYSGADDDDIELPPLRVLTDLEAQQLKPPASLIAGILPQKSLALLIGPWGTWKSFIAISMALCLATGRSWLGHAVTGGPVVYICSEGEEAIGSRISAWKAYNNFPVTQQTDFLLIPDVVNFLETAELERLIDAIYAKGIWPVAIFVDTVAWSMGGAEENSNAVASKMVMGMRVLRQRYNGCSVLGVHHEGTDVTHGARGATAFECNVDTLFETRVPKGTSATDLTVGKPIWFVNRKAKDWGKFPQFALTTELVDGDYLGEPFSSLAITDAVDAEPLPADNAVHLLPDSPPKGEFTDNQCLAWRELAKYCATTVSGATYNAWKMLCLRTGKMEKTAFKGCRAHLMDTGWVLQVDKHYKVSRPLGGGEHGINDDDDDV